MTKSPEQYRPSTKELNEAKGMMNKKEEKMSSMREKAIENIGRELFRDLKEGKFDLRIASNIKKDITKKDLQRLYDEEFQTGNNGVLEGKIGEHQIYIELDQQAKHDWSKYKAHGEIDGEQIDDELAIELFNKYRDVANLQDGGIFNSFEEEADKEIRAEEEEKRREEEEEKKKKEWEESPKYKEMQERKKGEEEEKRKEEYEQKKRVDAGKEKYKDIL
ncbi:MAG: hypothetical protein NTU85_00740 [Candidatus Kaiserbacteria bacterium]|nr:hypothetical protein [Candidatus Kaiserbacteria bacterium]